MNTEDVPLAATSVNYTGWHFRLNFEILQKLTLPLAADCSIKKAVFVIMVIYKIYYTILDPTLKTVICMIKLLNLFLDSIYFCSNNKHN